MFVFLELKNIPFNEISFVLLKVFWKIFNIDGNGSLYFYMTFFDTFYVLVYQIRHILGCGFKQRGKIVGGQDAGNGEWPWQLRLQFGRNRLCGGVLISNKCAITAAHCVMGYE